ncbi:hypothetical protein ASPWEDRAFT_41797 [Aspergillus wentii DTO 134E9]|uniref:Sulfhydryl oxidase n=1 Tax=Aspergillus wentii DTO 134E9 TaxID=1073089 RepID=A0A1L9RG41_ASPWE|nr:uncharacterized protein ASPWEDRAFT_41797 [Aspergillus wentii DTO 134E9]KAI9927697.1 hypothetical protein MW887_002549 [Aspergillus wentii]OJJ33909.1 hypothetical protein ASPWEDRAFT_41797 [Aspergillus wentii DTO 134E9]
MAETHSNATAAQSRPTMSMFAPHQASTASSSTTPKEDDSSKANLPKGVVLDKDGKPCRLCTSAASWRTMTKQASQSQSQSQPQETQPKPSTAIPKSIATAASTVPTTTSTPRSDCPPDVDALGRSTWTFLHSLAASYPEKASAEQQTEMSSFMKIFSRIYPCWVCADDFQKWMAEPSGRNKPRLSGRSDFGNWLCDAHNEVNRKLGKKEFDCRLWEQRWRTGWKDGSCD